MNGAIIVTGAARGIGRAIATQLAATGRPVALADRDPGVKAVAASLVADGHSAYGQVCDVTDPAAIATLVAQTRSELGPLDGLVTAAAISLGGGTLDVTPEVWTQTLKTNVTGPFLCGRAVAAALVADRRSGSIVNIGSVNGIAAEREHVAYVTAKGAIAALTRAMAVDLAAHDIRVNTVAPGAIDTDLLADAAKPQPATSDLVRNIPAARRGSPEEVAGTVAFLLSADARYLTGATIVVDGGYSAYLRSD